MKAYVAGIQSITSKSGDKYVIAHLLITSKFGEGRQCFKGFVKGVPSKLVIGKDVDVDVIFPQKGSDCGTVIIM